MKCIHVRKLHDIHAKVWPTLGVEVLYNLFGSTLHTLHIIKTPQAYNN